MSLITSLFDILSSSDKPIAKTTHSQVDKEFLKASELGDTLKVISYLDEKHADINARTPAGYTPLHFLSMNKHATGAFINVLLRGADINAKDHAGFTPLHLATLAKNIPAIVQLVHHKADTSIKTYAGDTALDLALTLNDGKEKAEIIRLLKGATPEDSSSSSSHTAVLEEPLIENLIDAFIRDLTE